MHATISLCITLLAATSSAEAQRYRIDSDHTTARFEVRAFGVAEEHGWFDRIEGTVVLDAKTRTGSVNVVIDACSVRATNADLERLIRGSGFLDVDRYPQILYRAERVTFKGDNPDQIDGDLTLLDITRSIPLEVTAYSCVDRMGERRCTLDATANLKRSEFGMDHYQSIAGDELQLTISAEGTPLP